MGKITGRSSTIMGEYIKGVLEENKLSEKESHFEKFGLNLKKCSYCGNDANTLDHIFSTISESKFTGYDNNIRNLIPCCQMCNSSKGKKTVSEWLDNPTTKGAKRVVKRPGYNERRKIVDMYIKLNKSNEKVIDEKTLELLNKRAIEFKKIEEKKLKELEQILVDDKNYYEKLMLSRKA